MALILSIIILSSYCLLVLYASTEWFSAFWKTNTLVKSIYTVGLILPGLFLVSLLAKERFIYFWDYAGYWRMAISFTELFFREPLGALDTLYHSINDYEYNYLPNLLLAPVNKLFGLNFPIYVFSIYLIYLIPLSLIISSLCIKVVNIKSQQLKLALPLICLVFTPLVIAMRFGMLDMIGLIPVFIVLKILVNRNFLVHKNYTSALIIGLFLTLLLFTRRWYIFWVLAYFPTLFIANAIQSVVQKQRAILFNTIINLAITGCVILGIVIVFFHPYFEMAVSKDYREIYSAYQVPFFKQLMGFVNFYGLLIIALCCVGAVFLYRKNDNSKKLVFFLLISTPLIVIPFTRINGFAIHHYYLLAPFVVVSFLFGATAAKSCFKKPVFIAFVAVIAVNYVSVFVFPVFPSSRLFASIDAKPKLRNDFSEINRISDDLVALQNQGNYVYILAGSGLFNDDIVGNTRFPDINHHHALLATQVVDKRDGFPNSLFLANYVVVTDPVQLAREGYQYLIEYLNEQIHNGILKDHYETVKDYTIDRGVKVLLKRRLSVPTQHEILKIKHFFQEKYPEFPSMYHIDESLAQISSVIKGDAYGKIAFDQGHLIIIPGNERPSEISFSLDSTKNYTMSFNAGFANKEDILRNCDPENDAEVFLTIYTDDNVYDQSYLTHRKDSVYRISVSGIHGIKIQVDKGKNEDWCDWFQLNDFKITQN